MAPYFLPEPSEVNLTALRPGPLRATVTVRLVALAIATLALGLAGCGAQPAVNPKALEATVEARLIATQTATAPTAIPTPAVTPTPDLLSMIPPKRDYKHDAQISSNYDKLKDQTMLLLDSNRYDSLDRPVEMVAAWWYKGQTLGPPIEILVVFRSTTQDWQWLYVQNMTFLLDGAKRLPVNVLRQGKVNSGSPGTVTEEVSVEFTLTQFLQLVNAKKVEFQIARKGYALTEAELNGLRDLASRMNP